MDRFIKILILAFLPGFAWSQQMYIQTPSSYAKQYKYLHLDTESNALTINANGYSSYIVQRKTSGDFSNIDTTTETSYTDATATEGTLYYYRIESSGDQSSEQKGGKFPYASLNGTDEYFTLSHKSEIAYTLDSAFTIESWFRPVTTTSSQRLFSKVSGSNAIIIFLEYDSDNTPYISVQFGGSSNIWKMAADAEDSYDSQHLFQDLEFYHLVVTYDGSGVRTGITIYINGYEATGLTTVSNLGTPVIANTEGINIGYNGSSQFYKFDYLMTRMFSGELSAANALTLFNSGVPLYDASGVATAKLEHTMLQDSLGGANWIPYDSGESPGYGSSSGLLSSEKVFTHSLPGFFRKNHTFGTKLTQGSDKVGGLTFGTTNNYKSPILTKDFAPIIIYDNGTSYIAGHGRGQAGFANKPLVYSFNHRSKALRIDTIYDAQDSRFSDDVHTGPALNKIGDQWNLWIENVHCNEIKAYSGAEPGEMSQQSLLSGKPSYIQTFNFNDTSFAFVRGGNNDCQRYNHVYYSSNNWSSSSSNMVVDLGNDYWAYPHCISNDSVTYCFINSRQDAGGSNYKHLFAIKTTDGINYTNLSGSYSQDSGSSQFFDTTELKTYCLIDSVTSVSSQTVRWLDGFIKDGIPYFVARNTETDTTTLYYYDGTLNSVALPWNTLSSDMRSICIIPVQGQEFDLFMIDSIDNYTVPVRYKTTDNFATFGPVLQLEAGSNHQALQCNARREDGNPIILVCNQLVGTNEETKLWLYEYHVK